MERIALEVVRNNRARVVRIRSVLAVFGGQHLITLPTVRVPLSGSVPALSECETWELQGALEAEIRGWAAKLPLDY